MKQSKPIKPPSALSPGAVRIRRHRNRCLASGIVRTEIKIAENDKSLVMSLVELLRSNPTDDSIRRNLRRFIDNDQLNDIRMDNIQRDRSRERRTDIGQPSSSRRQADQQSPGITGSAHSSSAAHNMALYRTNKRPSDQQLDLMDRICREQNIVCPADVTMDGGMLRQWISQQKRNRR